MRNPHSNSIICTYEIKVWREDVAGAERKKLRTVMRKFSNGTASRVLEKRKFYARSGDFYVGSQMGFNTADIDFIVEHSNEIRETLAMDGNTLSEMTQSEKILPDGRVMLDGKVYDIDKFYPKRFGG